jgi:hypothetical protein
LLLGAGKIGATDFHIAAQPFQPLGRFGLELDELRLRRPPFCLDSGDRGRPFLDFIDGREDRIFQLALFFLGMSYFDLFGGIFFLSGEAGELIFEFGEPQIGLFERAFILALLELELCDGIEMTLVGIPGGIQFLLVFLENPRPAIDLSL